MNESNSRKLKFFEMTQHRFSLQFTHSHYHTHALDSRRKKKIFILLHRLSKQSERVFVKFRFQCVLVVACWFFFSIQFNKLCPKAYIHIFSIVGVGPVKSQRIHSRTLCGITIYILCSKNTLVRKSFYKFFFLFC